MVVKKRTKQQLGSGLTAGLLVAIGLWAYAPGLSIGLMVAAILGGAVVGAVVGPLAIDLILTVL